jgi:hypothetical protein
MSNLNDNRTMLMTFIRGQVNNKPRIYDLREYGGFDILVTKGPQTEEQLIEAGQRNYQKKRDDLIEFAKEYPELCENMSLTEVQFDWVRDLLSEQVRSEYEMKFRGG